jgi:hypothetical protein
MVAFRRYALYGAIPVAVVLGVVALRLGDDDHATSRETYAELVAKNYRVLTHAQSRTLVRYADSVYGCLAAHGASGVAPPVASATRITMRAPGRSAMALVTLMMRCDSAVGPPPAKSSLQARPGMILLYLPKQCLLDPAQVAGES